MTYTKEEIMEYVEQEDVKFIRLSFCDVFGKLKNIAILPTELEKAFDNGIVVAASALDGFEEGVRTDLYLKPDPSTLIFLPWRPQNGRVVRLFCDVVYSDGTPFACDSRRILKEAVEAAKEKGLTFDFGCSLEFYLFKTDGNGDRTYIPYDHAGYMDIAPEDKGENVRREICLSLEQMGIIPESSHHEVGPGQNEINFRYSDPLTAADNAVVFKTVVSSIAAGSGLYADFSPKPLADGPGSGFHVHFSVCSKNGENVLAPVIAGILAKIKEMTLFLNPLKESYGRIGKSKAPGHISWSEGTLSQLIRKPVFTAGNPRAELRSPDPAANPYIVYALIIYAGLYGVENALECPPPSEVNFSTATGEETAGFEKLPESREAAAGSAADSEFIRACLPANVIGKYISGQK